MTLAEDFLELKEEKNAVVLAHNYQRPEIQDVADHIGDSLELSRLAVKTSADIILFCGVDFMAETAKILNPDKTVLMPDSNACCPMAKMLDVSELRAAKEQNPDAEVVLYVNTRAEAKAECDCVCTSANADKIVNAMDSDTVIFGPDKNLAYYVSQRSDKKLVVVPPHGICYSHNSMTLADLDNASSEYPEAKVVVHPECIPELQEAADKVASTSGILRYCAQTDARDFIIGTENGMLYRLKKENPKKQFHALSDAAVCSDMKKSTLEKAYLALESEKPAIELSDDVIDKSLRAIHRMLDLSK